MRTACLLFCVAAFAFAVSTEGATEVPEAPATDDLGENYDPEKHAKDEMKNMDKNSVRLPTCT